MDRDMSTLNHQSTRTRRMMLSQAQSRAKTHTHTHTHEHTIQHNMLQNKAGLGMYDDIEQAPLIKPTSKHQTVQMEENIKREY